MREAYTGKEVSVSALRPLLDQLHDKEDLEYVKRLIPINATRVSWDVMCELLDHCIPSAADARRIGKDAVSSSAYKYRQRLRFVNGILGVEQIVRYLIFPRNPIDFSCISHAVSGAPGRIDLLLYINSRYQANPTFYNVVEGAAEEIIRILNLPDGQVTMTVHGSQAHIAVTFCEGKGFLHKMQTACRRSIGNFLLRRLALSSYPDLVAGRKIFEEQLIERAKLEDQLRVAQSDFNSRINQVDEIIADIDAAGNLVYVSPNVKRLIGLSDTATPEEFSRIVHQADLARVSQSIESALRDPQNCRVDDFRIFDATGLIRWVEIDFRHTEHSPPRLVAVGRDISERRQRHQDQMTMERQLEQTQRLEVLGVLSAGMAHDFNNLLVPILGEAELAGLELDEDSSARVRLKRIHTAAGKAADLIRQLNVFAGGTRSASRVIDLSREARELLEIVKTSISPHVALTTHLNAGTFIEGDASQIQQVIMNLVINAAEAIGDNPGEIVVAVSAEDDFIELTVSDNGPGMDEWTKARAFEPFYTTKFTGRGLGLAAVMGITRKHNGEIIVDSSPGQGTQVTLRLTRAPDKDQTASPSIDFSAQFAGRALVVDDDQAVLTVASALMENLGFEVDTAIDGAGALDLFSKRAYSIIVVDLVMPKVDGREVLAAIRQQTPALPVVIVSGYASSAMDNEFTGDPATRFLSKPYQLDQLGKTLWSLKHLILPIEIAETSSR